MEFRKRPLVAHGQKTCIWASVPRVEILRQRHEFTTLLNEQEERFLIQHEVIKDIPYEIYLVLSAFVSQEREQYCVAC